MNKEELQVEPKKSEGLNAPNMIMEGGDGESWKMKTNPNLSDLETRFNQVKT